MQNTPWHASLLVMVALAAGACRHSPLPTSSLIAAANVGAPRETVAGHGVAPRSVSITVTHLAPGRWQADYALTESANRVRFVRDPSTFRRDQWEVVTPGLRLASVDGSDFIESDGAPFRALTLRFASDPTKHEREYVLTPQFTDASEALYTGLLYVEAADTQSSWTATTVRLTPAAGESVVVGGAVHQHSAIWTDSVGAGTYAYFGRIAPTVSPHVIGIVDPGLPDHLRQMLQDGLPQLFDYFTRKLRAPLPQKPTILIGFSPTAGHGLSNSGDVLPNVIRLGYDGEAWAHDGAQPRRQAFHLLAHEVVHLWNNALFSPTDGSREPWMHEGGADALAWLAMRDMGLLGEQELRNELEGALNECTFIDRGRPLGQIMNASRVPYACGAVINMMAASAMREQGGLTALWKALFAAAEQTGNRYGSELYFATLTRVAGDDQLALALQRLLAEPRAGGSPPFIAEFEQLGIRVERDHRSLGVERARQLLHRVMTELMTADCAGRYSVSGDPEGFRVTGVADCQALPEGVSRITAFAGHSLRDDASGAYFAVVRRCATVGRVALSIVGRDADLTLTCPREYPAYFHVEEWPLHTSDTPSGP